MNRVIRKGGAYLLLVPAVFLVLGTELVPVVYTTYLSFLKWDIINPPQWVGLTNYARLFSTPALLVGLRNTMFWILGTLIFPVGLALFLAILINQVKMKWLFKTIFFVPAVLSPTVTGVIWRRVLATQNGAVNSLLERLGFAPVQMLMNPSINTFLMIGAWTWGFLGLNLIILLVGLETIPKEPIEAARIDGASSWQVFRYITLPLLQPISMVIIVIAVINSAKMFDIPWVMTQGAPGRASETLAIALYRESFSLFQMGLGSAIAVVITIITFAFSWRFLRAVTKC